MAKRSMGRYPLTSKDSMLPFIMLSKSIRLIKLSKLDVTEPIWSSKIDLFSFRRTYLGMKDDEIHSNVSMEK